MLKPHVVLLLAMAVGAPCFADSPARDPLAPRGKIHIPIGIPNTNDRLKTFVEPEGCFSPGVGSYGIYFWATDPFTGKLVAPTMDGVKVEHGLAPGGLPIPWSRWSAGTLAIESRLCQAPRASPWGDVQVVAARVALHNTASAPVKSRFFVALRPVGPAGFEVKDLAFDDEATRCSILVDRHPAVVPMKKPSWLQAVSHRDISGFINDGVESAPGISIKNAAGNISAAVGYDVALGPGEKMRLDFIFPVLPGRRVPPHQWDGVSAWAQFDLAPYNPAEVGELQPDPGLAYFQALDVDELFAAAEKHWKDLVARAAIRLPDPRWAEAMSAITAHAALCMNDGAPDVAVVNYNVFNRDGVYVTNILQKAGRPDLAEKCIDYFISHPFNGRVQPEADNPGQILWIMGQHWLFSRDAKWLARVYPSAAKLAGMIRYYRTAPEPHWVWDTSLEFGEALGADRRKRLKPGACDGHHPEYTEAFDIAGLRAAAALARAMGKPEDEKAFASLAGELFQKYDSVFGKTLPRGYGSYCVLWPCGLYAGTGRDDAMLQFRSLGPQRPSGWRYFPLARAHQSLLAGNRDAACRTIELHLDHEQMKGFYAFDEGGKSGAGGWKDKSGQPRLRTTWNGDVAMPHGWAIAELHLLIRDSLAFEQQDRLILLAGIPVEWFGREIRMENLPTQFGPLNLTATPTDGGARITVHGCAPPGGMIIRGPREDYPIAPDSSVTVPGAGN